MPIGAVVSPRFCLNFSIKFADTGTRSCLWGERVDTTVDFVLLVGDSSLLILTLLALDGKRLFELLVSSGWNLNS